MGMQAIFGGLRLTTSIFYLYIYIFITLVLRLDSRGLYNDVYIIYIYISIVIGDDIQIGIIAVI
jgi:hypothetical protein